MFPSMVLQSFHLKIIWQTESPDWFVESIWWVKLNLVLSNQFADLMESHTCTNTHVIELIHLIESVWQFKPHFSFQCFQSFPWPSLSSKCFCMPLLSIPSTCLLFFFLGFQAYSYPWNIFRDQKSPFLSKSQHGAALFSEQNILNDQSTSVKPLHEQDCVNRLISFFKSISSYCL